MPVKLSTLEKALMGAIGMDVARPGTSRQALVKTVQGLGRLTGIAARRAAVPAARGALGLASGLVRRHPVGFAGLTLAEAYRMGLLDEPLADTREFLEEGAAQTLEMGFDRQPQGPPPGFQGLRAKPKKKVSAYNRSVKAGMAALKKSKFNGKAGKFKSPKAAFKMVNKLASAKRKGKKAPKSGAGRAIWRALPNPPKFNIKVRK